MLSTCSLTAKNDEDLFADFKSVHGINKLETWNNNNSTQLQQAYIKDLTSLYIEPSLIISDLFALKLKHKDQTFVAVPVAGWKPIKTIPLEGVFSGKEALEEEYAQSFSLSALTTAKNASLVLRASKHAQHMDIFKNGDQHFLRVSAGVRITDADQYLFDHGFALPPNMPTLHVASLVGAAANGCYGPARDLRSMTTDIVEMKIINAMGDCLTLSEKENFHLFEVLRDCHIGTLFVSEITMKIEPKFLMKRHNMLFKDVSELKKSMMTTNYIANEHFIAMYIPVDITEKGDHCPRVMIINFEKTNEKPTNKLKTAKDKDYCDSLSLALTETGEPLIDLITKTAMLRRFFPLILKTAALKTYGLVKDTVEIDWSANIAHVFGTYTDLPIYDINWLIQVEDADDARQLFLSLIRQAENSLVDAAKHKHFPLLNAFSRYLKGTCYPEGKGGISPTAVDSEHQHILSFEFVTYMPLNETKAFHTLVNQVIGYLDKKGRKYNYHPGKHMPDNIHSLEQLLTDKNGKQRLKNFQEVVGELHGNIEDVQYSPFLTPQKKEFLGLNSVKIEKQNDKSENSITKKQEREALQAILKIAKEDEVQNEGMIKNAVKYIKRIDQ